MKPLDLKDLSEAKYTAIISDLHLCEEEPVNLKYPFWKKYKTRQFFFDDTFANFLQHLEIKSAGEPVELVLNGDIFDFDSTTHIPENPPYRVTWLEQRRGLHPQEEKSVDKMKKIITDHKIWFEALEKFIKNGNRVIFVVGNHDLELHFPKVKEEILKTLDLTEDQTKQVRFTEWFYISNKDTLIEHGHQYDPYCLTNDPVSPFVLKFNKIEVRIPFGNLATRYLINGMGFFNPYVDKSFVMTAKEYVVFFFKYIVKAEPFLMVTWFWSSMVILIQSFFDNLLSPLREPLEIEGRIEYIAAKSNATPRMVRELRALTVPAAASRPWMILKELWLDRALIVLISFFALFQLFIFISNVFKISFFWVFIPLAIFAPFFIFYSQSITSDLADVKEPRDDLLTMASMITGVSRIIHGHTHIVRHELIGPVEHLNSGTWSSAFEDVECEKPIDQKTYIWLEPKDEKGRQAKLYQFKDGIEGEVLTGGERKKIQNAMR